jgi:hypothetical protein
MIVMMLDRYAIIGLNWNVNDKVELRSEYGFYGDANDECLFLVSNVNNEAHRNVNDCLLECSW